MRWLLIITSALAWLMLTACNDRPLPSRQGQRANSVDLAGRQELYGCDPRAWLTRFGDNADSCDCAAELVLPLHPKQSWETSYSSAEFSSSSPQGIIHYDGVLCVSSRTPQLMLLDTTTGSVVFNENVHFSAVLDTMAPLIFAPFFHPAGLLLVRDETAVTYCYDLNQDQLSKKPLWTVDSNLAGADDSCVAMDGVVVIGGQGRTRGVSITNGTELWSYPSLQPYPGKVLSKDGVMVWLSQYGKILALELVSGRLLWSLNQQEQISRTIIDDKNSCVYITSYDERIECRDLHTGQLRWEYSWRFLLSEAERARLTERILTTYQFQLDRVRLFADTITCAPHGVILALVDGTVIALDETGKVRWLTATGVPVVMAVAFNNGVLLLQEYSQVASQRQLGKYMPFTLDPPDWKVYQQATAERKLNLQFDRFVVLSEDRGQELSVYEMEKRVSTGPVPAYNMIVVGLEGVTGTRCSIAAWPWVNWKGSN